MVRQIKVVTDGNHIAKRTCHVLLDRCVVVEDVLQTIDVLGAMITVNASRTPRASGHPRMIVNVFHVTLRVENVKQLKTETFILKVNVIRNATPGHGCVETRESVLRSRMGQVLI